LSLLFVHDGRMGEPIAEDILPTIAILL